MITVTSNYVESLKGFPDITTFSFNITLPSGSTLTSIDYVWGDNTKVKVTNLNTTQKIYKKTGTYNIVATITYVSNKKTKTEIQKFSIIVKPIPLKKFIITRTVRKDTDANYARATKFTLKPDPEFFGKDLLDLKLIQWDLGNGVISNNPTLSNFTFDSSGDFKIKMLAYTKSNIKYEDEQTVTIREYINDSIKFIKIPPPTPAGHINKFPFEVEITSPISEQDHFVDLYAQFSRSRPSLDIPTKYTFLRAEWRFLDTSLNKIDSVKITKDPYPIKINEYGEEIKKVFFELPMVDGTMSRLLTDEYKNGITVGIRGKGKFYFVDDWYNQDQVTKKEQYTTLWATLRSNLIRNNTVTNNIDGLHPGHANSTAQTYIPYVTLWREPDIIKFTRNGCNPLPVMQWSGSDIPFIASLGYKNPVAVLETDKINENAVSLYDSLGGFCRYLPFSEKEEIPLNLVFSNTQTPVSSFLNKREEPIIKYKDSEDFLTGGYYRNIFQRSESSNIQFSANVLFNEPNLEANNYNPYIWTLNTISGKVNVSQYVYTTNLIINSPQYFNSKTIDTYDDLFEKNKLPITGTVNKNKNMDTAVTLPIDTEIKTIPHVSSPLDNKGALNGLYCIAAMNYPSYHAWVCDIELDKIYKISPDGTIKKTINLQELGLFPKISPSTKLNPNNIVLDFDLNLFVTLSKTNHILKFDKNGTLKKITSLAKSGSSLNGVPVSLDVDKNNNVYVGVIYGKNSDLIKFNNNLTDKLKTKTYTNSYIGNIVISPENKIYVINNGNLDEKLNQTYSNDSFIEVLDENLIEHSISSKYKTKKFPIIKNLVLDKNESLYFNYSYNNIAKIDKNGVLFKTNITVLRKNDTINKSIIEGLTYNLNDRLYVINSLENKIHIINSETLKEESSFYINPSNIEYELNSEGQLKKPFISKESLFSKSLKSIGDFNGWKWNYKFTYTKQSKQKTISNTSVNILLANQDSFKFFAENENFDMGKTMYDYSFMKTLQESPFLYNNKIYDLNILQDKNNKLNQEISKVSRELQQALNNKTDAEIKEIQNELRRLQDDRTQSYGIYTQKKGFMGSIFGSYPYKPDDIGIELFSNIANFVKKSADIDTCDIPHLYSIMDEVDFNENSFKVRFPKGISRIVDYCSISPHKLMGVNCNCGDIFTSNAYGYGVCSYCGNERTSNKGPEIKDENYKIKAGNFYVLKYDKFKNKYRKISTGLLDGESEYTITKLATSIGLPEYWKNSYSFFEYVSSSKNFAVTNYRYITSYNDSQYRALTSSIVNISAEFMPVEVLSPQVSTISYEITGNYYFSTGNKDEWFLMTDNKYPWTNLDFFSSFQDPVYTMSYKTIQYVSSVPFTNYDSYVLELTSVKQLTSISNKGIKTLTNNLTSIKYKTFYRLDSKFRIENVIDWDNSQTTVPSNLNNTQWYSVNGPVERMINFELQKGLGLI
jgi:hypothetical protein